MASNGIISRRDVNGFSVSFKGIRLGNSHMWKIGRASKLWVENGENANCWEGR